ncbi:hypothetical protein FEM33_15260 [Dyadobacter flavalbus]|uniref:Uncharacterized protein n=1 Tax=Dyadobacter flavalbus TaxID=2579942 RepID=A0A5M8QUA3_9BACT|nr:hypothetical protein [Dyadobacter flavalbus]KAA6438871.1 hypothetical protein FEM33_15260 [Dyadobacter flavalbus]
MEDDINKEEKGESSLKDVFALTMADIDIFLLQNEEQTEYLDKVFTKEEIRSQLKNSLIKILNIFEDQMVNINLPVFPALKFYAAVHHPDISDKELVSLRKEHQELFDIK